MTLKQTHTYALLYVSDAAYTEIRAALEEAGYQHAINAEGELGMQGIALVVDATNGGLAKPVRADKITYYCDQCGALLPAPPHSGAHECPGFNVQRAAEGLHCATCQCNKLHPTPPVPENPRSKSWHENALTERPKS